MLWLWVGFWVEIRLWVVFDLGMAMGQGEAGAKDGVFAPVLHGFVLPHLGPASHDGENFLASSSPLRAPPHPVKL